MVAEAEDGWGYSAHMWPCKCNTDILLRRVSKPCTMVLRKNTRTVAVRSAVRTTLQARAAHFTLQSGPAERVWDWSCPQHPALISLRVVGKATALNAQVERWRNGLYDVRCQTHPCKACQVRDVPGSTCAPG